MNARDRGIEILAMARKDLAALEGMMEDTVHFSDEVFGFHAEQAVEKALKAWIASLGEAYPFTHDLSMLFELLRKHGVKIQDWIDLLELGSFGVQFRYEEMTQDDEPLERKALFSRIRSLLKEVETAMARSG
jgi:HEPN domain-containing protein